LGQLFRSSSYQQEKTDLLVAVTPHLVTPVKEGELKFPGENMEIPTSYEYYLEGRLEGRRDDDNKSSFSQHWSLLQPTSPRVGGLEGNFGHQPVIQSSQKERQ